MGFLHPHQDLRAALKLSYDSASTRMEPHILLSHALSKIWKLRQQVTHSNGTDYSKTVFLKDFININLNAGKIYYIRFNLKQLNANSCRQGDHVVHGIVREFLASLAGSHQNTPAVADDLGPKVKLTTLVQ